LPVMPVRVYAGLNAAATIEERVRLTVDELERQGGLERSLVVVSSPTGSGLVHGVMSESVERLADGDVATVAVQFQRMPSVVSLPVRDVGARTQEALLTALKERIDARFPHGD